MPTFLWFYVVGLGLAFVVGMVLYYTIGGHCTPLMQHLFGDSAGYLWGRSFRLMLMTSAVVGGLSTQWYGCGGYTDYDAVERDRQVMFQKTTEQVAGAVQYATTFLVLASALGAIAYAILPQKHPDNRPESDSVAKEQGQSMPEQPH